MTNFQNLAKFAGKTLLLAVLITTSSCKKNEQQLGYYYPQLVGGWVDDERTYELSLTEDGHLKVQHSTERGIAMKITTVQQLYPAKPGEITLYFHSKDHKYVGLTWYPDEDILEIKGHNLRRE